MKQPDNVCHWFVSMSQVSDSGPTTRPAAQPLTLADMECSSCTLPVYLFVSIANLCEIQSGSLGFPQGRHRGLFTFNVLSRTLKTPGRLSWSRRNKYQENLIIFFTVCWYEDILARLDSEEILINRHIRLCFTCCWQKCIDMIIQHLPINLRKIKTSTDN